MNIEQVLIMVEDERLRQDRKFGANEDRNLGAATRYRILLEECGEVAHELEFDEAGDEVIDTDALRRELVQVAAVCMSWMVALGASRFSVLNTIRVEALNWGKPYPSSPPADPDEWCLQLGKNLGRVADVVGLPIKTWLREETQLGLCAGTAAAWAASLPGGLALE